MRTLALSLLIFFSFSALSYEFKDSKHLLEEAFEVHSNELVAEKTRRKHTEYKGSILLRELINPVPTESEKTQEVLTFDYLFYMPKNLKKANLIVVTPTIGGVSFFEKTIAKRLANAGYPVLIPIERKRVNAALYDDFTFVRMERHVRRAMAASFHEIAVLKEEFPEIKIASMGAVGASLGGIRSSILLSLSNNFKAAFIAVAGGDIASIYKDTQLEELVTFREEHMEYLGVESKTLYTDLMRAEFFLDPMNIIRNENLKNVAMTISNNDNTVSTQSQWNLFTAIKEAGVHPKTFITEGGHGIGAASLLLKKDFLESLFTF